MSELKRKDYLESNYDELKAVNKIEIDNQIKAEKSELKTLIAQKEEAVNNAELALTKGLRNKNLSVSEIFILKTSVDTAKNNLEETKEVQKLYY